MTVRLLRDDRWNRRGGQEPARWQHDVVPRTPKAAVPHQLSIDQRITRGVGVGFGNPQPDRLPFLDGRERNQDDPRVLLDFFVDMDVPSGQLLTSRHLGLQRFTRIQDFG